MSSETYTLSFDEVKRSVPMEKVLAFLSIPELKQRGQGQWKGVCPFCKNRECFVINAEGGKDKTGAFNCFKCPAGGDQIELVSMARGHPRKDSKGVYAAAKELHEAFVATVESRAENAPQPARERRQGFDPQAYGRNLDAGHEALKPLDVEAETYVHWKAGYASTGVHRGRLALPLAAKDGTVVGYIGRAILDDPPILTFPNGLVPQNHIFGSDRVTAGPIFLVRDPIEVLKAYETGCGNAVCFLTEDISALQLECLTALMDERSCESLSFF